MKKRLSCKKAWIVIEGECVQVSWGARRTTSIPEMDVFLCFVTSEVCCSGCLGNLKRRGACPNDPYIQENPFKWKVISETSKGQLSGFL